MKTPTKKAATKNAKSTPKKRTRAAAETVASGATNAESSPGPTPSGAEATRERSADQPASGAGSKPLRKKNAPLATNAKPEKQPPHPTPKARTIKSMSALDAAALVIAESKEPMRATDLIKQMEARKLWTSPGGKTPEATLYAAIIREIAAKGKDARFKKHDRGLFVAGKGVAA